MSEKNPSTSFTFDTRPLAAANDELEVYLERARTADAAPNLRKLLAKPEKLVSSHSYIRRTGRTCEGVVVFEPSKRFRKLLSALAAGESHRHSVD